MAGISNQLVWGLMNPSFGNNLANSVAGLGGGIVQGREQGRARQEDETKQRGMLEIMELSTKAAPGSKEMMQGSSAIGRAYGLSAAEVSQGMQNGLAMQDAQYQSKLRGQQQSDRKLSQLDQLQTGQDEISGGIDAKRARAIVMKQAAEAGDQKLWNAVKTGSVDPQQYLAAQLAPKERQTTTLGPNESLVDTSSGEVVVAPSGGVGDSTFRGAVLQSGLDINSSDPAVIQQLESIALMTGEPSIANNLTTRRKAISANAQGFSITDSRAQMQAVNPAFVGYEELIETSNRIDTLVANGDLAGATSLIERLVTSQAPNDIKAASELKNFRGSKSFPRRIGDAFQKFTIGELSNATLEDYKALSASMREYSAASANKTIDNFEASSPDRADEAQWWRNNLGTRDGTAGWSLESVE